jgi:phenylacetate-CoA ligase
MRISTLIRTRIEHIRNARSTREALEARRLARFRRLAAHAALRSPYYRELVESRGIDLARCTPADFPVLTKTGLMEHLDRIVTDPRVTRRAIIAFLERSRNPYDLLEDEFYVVHTSGSSGEVGLFVYSRDDWTRGVAHSLRMQPPRLARRRVAFFGATSGHFTGVTIATTARRPVLRRFYEVETFEINAPLRGIVERLNRFQPDILMGYASALALLAERQKRGELAIRPRWMQSSGEPVRPADRAAIEETFGIPLTNIYASTEHLVMGWSRPEFDGMYLLEDDLIFELRPDHTLVTNLFNYTLPLIRYRMSDVLVEKEDPEPRLPFRKVEEIVGRSEQIPIFLNERGEEDFISPHTVNEFLVRDVRRFQLEIRGRAACRFRVALEDGLTEVERRRTLTEVRAELGRIFAEKEMRNVTIEVEEVEDLLPDPRTGKFRLIIPLAAPEPVPGT